MFFVSDVFISAATRIIFYKLKSGASDIAQFVRFILVYVCEFFTCVYICVCATCVPGACRSQKRLLDSLEMELLLMAVSYHVSAGNQTHVTLTL